MGAVSEIGPIDYLVVELPGTRLNGKAGRVRRGRPGAPPERVLTEAEFAPQTALILAS